MMEEELVVEVLHHILDQTSNDILGDCREIIDKLFKSIECTESFSLNKTLCSIKLLLNLYEKVHLSSSRAESTLPVDAIFKGLNCIRSKRFCDVSLKNDFLAIISVLCKIRLTCGIPKLTELLTAFYCDILSEVRALSSQKDYDSEEAMLLLKILYTLYNSRFCEVHNLIQANDGTDECLPFGVLALHGDESIAVQTSLFLVPEYVKFFKTISPIKYIWSEFSKLDARNYSRLFLILCNFLSVNLLIDEMNIVEFLIGRVKYWELIQYGVSSRDIIMRKQAMFVFKKTVDVLSKSRIDEGGGKHDSSECSEGQGYNRHWDPNRKDELLRIYSDIIVILEYLNEEQVHIVRPIFEMIDKVVEKSTQSELINFSWILTIYKIALAHESTEVVKWGIKSLLTVSVEVFSDEASVVKTAVILTSNLNNINLYYNNGLEITEKLSGFFLNMSGMKNAEAFFKTFIKEVCKQVWSPEALFFLTSSFSKLSKLSFWGSDEITEIRLFVSKAFRTHHKTIRNGIQCEILNAVMALTHGRNLPLDSVILLLSKFASEVFRTGYRTWTNLIAYLRNGYSSEEAERILDLFLNSSQHNGECAALSILLFQRVFADDFASKAFSKLLSCFKASHQRPYCDVHTLNRHLSVINLVIEKHVQYGEHPNLAALVFPFFEDIVLYIHSQTQVISNFEDFSVCQMHLKAFENLTKLIKRGGDFEDLFFRLLKSLELELCRRRELSSLQTYSRMRLIKIIYESCLHNQGPVYLDEYLLQHLNELLRKDESTKDVRGNWGKMNSEFFEAKWMVLEKIIREKKIQPTVETEKNYIHFEELLKLCAEGLDIGGYGVLRPVMHILAHILPLVKDVRELEMIVDSVWRMILETRKTDDFKFCLESFVKMLFQEKLFSKGEDILNVLNKYVDLIFSDSSLATVHALMRHAEQLELSVNSMSVLCLILAKGILFGPVQKKDEKLTAQICSYVTSPENCPESENVTSGIIRGRAVVKLLTIRRKKGVSKAILDFLMKLEAEITKKRTRYFENSFIHRIKTRLMQGVLILLDSFEKEELDKVGKWMYLSLNTENPQTSVRHLQEWSLSLLVKFYDFSFPFYEKKTPKSWCSLMTIWYLLSSDQSGDAFLWKIDEIIETILPFCMDQHFEVRLYAEVIIVKLYNLAKEIGLRETVEKWKVVSDSVKGSLSKAEGNALKNFTKLDNHFLFNGFNISRHYSLQTIYYDFPRLTNVAPDEWISPEVFAQITQPRIDDLGLNLRNNDRFLEMSNAEWVTGKSEEFITGDEQTGEELENYQKKMIPMEQLIPGCGGRFGGANESLEKEGLVVVASLIDRIPNLGGLARTCEVFGASELILNSAKCMEDKDFKSLSVTAEKWIRVTEVRAENLMSYVMEMKENGFRIIGAEQAVHSQPLTKTKFPRRCVLVLGNEKKGIPPNIIPLLDVCVEIPQAGIIRSLNVHVTGALFIWEYAKQNLFTGGEQ